jgi:hypothetical protein
MVVEETSLSLARLELSEAVVSASAVESLASAGGSEAISRQSKSNFAQISKKVYSSIGFPAKKRQIG